MACRNYYRRKTIFSEPDDVYDSISEPTVAKTVKRLLFGADSKIQSNDLLQNNIDQFEWVVRNKLYPLFYGRYLTGENCLTKDEAVFVAGDCRTKRVRQVTTATADGAVSALAACRYLDR